MDTPWPADAVALEPRQSSPLWERFFTVAPLVLVGTTAEDGAIDLAPKHMAMPLGWDNYFGFICTPRHRTWQNISASGQFSVSFPLADQLLFTSLAATPRCDDDTKPILGSLDVTRIPGTELPALARSYLWLQCRLLKLVEGFGSNGLVCGEVEALHVCAEALRTDDREDESVLSSVPLLAYVHPGRFAVIEESRSFPFPAGMKK